MCFVFFETTTINKVNNNNIWVLLHTYSGTYGECVCCACGCGNEVC